MAVAAIVPQLGNTVENCVIVEWKKAVGQPVAEGEGLVDVETDKAVMEVPSPASGVVLAHFFAPGDLVPVLTTIAAIGQPGEDVSALRPDGATAGKPTPDSSAATPAAPGQQTSAPSAPPATGEPRPFAGVSPRARNLAAREGVELSGLTGSGPGGRIIERDVQAALASRPKLSPLAQAKLAEGGFTAPERGSGPRGRVMARDLRPLAEEGAARKEEEARETRESGEMQKGEMREKREKEEETTVERVAGVRKVIAERMLASMQTTAQLTLNTSADARALQALRNRCKASPASFGLQGVTINDLILLAVARTLPQYPELNAHFQGDTITRFHRVHLGVAVDTPRGLMVPVIRRADQLGLRQIAQEAKRLAAACQERRITPDELSGGTFTVTNLGSLGIESFTPVLNPPEVAILGVGNINLKPVQAGEEVAFVPHIGLSLTINHQVVDGAPAARFLQALAQALANIDLLVIG